MQRLSLIFLLALLGACATTNTYDLLIENDTVYDGNGGEP